MAALLVLAQGAIHRVALDWVLGPSYEPEAGACIYGIVPAAGIASQSGKEARRYYAMRLFDFLHRRLATREVHMVGHIAGDPCVISNNGTRFMVFHLEEVPGTVFHLKMLPTTPKRHSGDRVEITFPQTNETTVFVESVLASADVEVIRGKNAACLARRRAQDEHGRN